MNEHIKWHATSKDETTSVKDVYNISDIHTTLILKTAIHSHMEEKEYEQYKESYRHIMNLMESS